MTIKNSFLTYCACGRTTSRKYAHAHNGMCKLCAEPDEIKIKVRDSEAEYWRQAARAEGGEDHAEYYGYE